MSALAHPSPAPDLVSLRQAVLAGRRLVARYGEALAEATLEAGERSGDAMRPLLGPAVVFALFGATPSKNQVKRTSCLRQLFLNAPIAVMLIVRKSRAGFLFDTLHCASTWLDK